jgi:hypothetical protein
VKTQKTSHQEFGIIMNTNPDKRYLPSKYVHVNPGANTKKEWGKTR